MSARRIDAQPADAGNVFLSSLLARPVWFRLAGVLAVLGVLWLLIAWAVSLP